MIPSDWVRLTTSPKDYDALAHYCGIRFSEISAEFVRSKIRHREDRIEKLKRDIWTGQCCEWALNMYIGTGLEGYVKAREEMKGKNFGTDGGHDVPGLPYDVKGTAWDAEFHKWKLPEKGHKWDWLSKMWVRQGEIRDNWFYIKGLRVAPKRGREQEVVLLGWCMTSELWDDPDESGRPRKAVWAQDLHPMQDLPKIRDIKYANLTA